MTSPSSIAPCEFQIKLELINRTSDVSFWSRSDVRSIDCVPSQSNKKTQRSLSSSSRIIFFGVGFGWIQIPLVQELVELPIGNPCCSGKSWLAKKDLPVRYFPQIDMGAINESL